MEEMEKRLIRVEEAMTRMEKLLERMVTTIEQLVEARARHDRHSTEIDNLRKASHDHANKLEHIVMLEKTVGHLAADVEKLKVQIARNSVIVSLISGGVAAGVALAVRSLF